MFNLDASERISRWREFRKLLDTMTFDQALEAVVEFWRLCPFSPYYLDPDHPEEWPDPWTLVEENWYCDLAKSVAMLYTIKFTKHAPEATVRVYLDPATGYSYNLVWIDQGKYVINYWHDEVVNNTQLDEELTLKYRYTAADLNLHTY